MAGRRLHADLWRRLHALPVDCALAWPDARPGHYYGNLYNRTSLGHRIRCKFHSIERNGKPHVLAVRYE